MSGCHFTRTAERRLKTNAAAPSYAKSPWNPAGLVPSPVNLMDGLLSGAALCLALVLDERLRRRTP